MLKADKPKASAGAVDSQSVKAVAPVRGEHGVDVFKQTRGIKRHLLVDTLGFIIALTVTEQNSSLQKFKDSANVLRLSEEMVAIAR